MSEKDKAKTNKRTSGKSRVTSGASGKEEKKIHAEETGSTKNRDRESEKDQVKEKQVKKRSGVSGPVTEQSGDFISDYDIHLFKEGKHFSLYERLGSHLTTRNGREGAFFAVWAPNAREVSVIFDANGWTPGSNPLTSRLDGSGIWEGFIPGMTQGSLYKYHLVSKSKNYRVEKTDPFAKYNELPPKTSSIVWELDYHWKDTAWMKNRGKHNSLDKPFSIYEMHLASWKRVPGEDNRSLNYVEMAYQLAEYLNYMGYTHVELLPVMEHPFSGSWGYQVVGFFAPTSRFGKPEEFMEFVDILHQNNIGVILDWVPSHFPGDEHGLHYFDGTYLFEHEDPRQGFHPDWSSYIFNYGRNEVRDFLISSAHLWLDKYHIDGLRVDAVASMLYLDYSRKAGEWIPNEFGGRENLDAISFLRDLNESIYTRFPDVVTIAEESTAWPMVTRPAYTGGLGFGMKWNMGWMHDTLSYFRNDPVHRSYHHNKLTFSIWYAFNENFMLSLSHDEVVHGKGSLINKMPGDDWQKFANLRLLFGFMFTHPGKKLQFMGMDMGQWREWDHDSSLDWHLLEHSNHKGLQQWIKELNETYKNTPALFEMDFVPEGFSWIDANDSPNSILSYARYSKDRKNVVITVCNMTPIPRYNYRIGVPEEGRWKEVLNSDGKNYGGSGQGN
ncbi:MAG: 1,4-alpha-glucan branching protein GlgB, partial [Cyclobacteriaceae bacterium]|nr:1,4-alpha-glucan branching protein GlgB [Cyclobacteriaceae bacterium]